MIAMVKGFRSGFASCRILRKLETLDGEPAGSDGREKLLVIRESTDHLGADGGVGVDVGEGSERRIEVKDRYRVKENIIGFEKRKWCGMCLREVPE